MSPLSPPSASLRYWAWSTGVATTAAYWYASEVFRRRRKVGRPYELSVPLRPGEELFMAAAEALTDAPVVKGNDAEVLINGNEIFPSLLDIIRSAERTVCLLNYVYWRSDIAHEVADAICERARAGVDCSILVDGIGSFTRGDAVIQRMTEAGARVRKFRPVSARGAQRIDYRTHRRVCVADGRVGQTGGVGIADEWTGDAETPDSFRETDVRVRGPVVRGLFGAFAQDWLDATGEVLAGHGHLPPLQPNADGALMQLVRSSPSVRDTNAEALYHLAIAAAQESIDITPAYLVPGPAFTKALRGAVARGVRVRIVVSGPRTNHFFMKFANRSSYGDLLDGGVEIHEFQPTMLHAKTMVVDGIWSSIGSINFDNRSFQLQNDATLCVQSERVAARLTEQFERDLQRSRRIDRDAWSRRRPVERALESVIDLARREL